MIKLSHLPNVQLQDLSYPAARWDPSHIAWVVWGQPSGWDPVPRVDTLGSILLPPLKCPTCWRWPWSSHPALAPAPKRHWPLTVFCICGAPRHFTWQQTFPFWKPGQFFVPSLSPSALLGHLHVFIHKNKAYLQLCTSPECRAYMMKIYVPWPWSTLPALEQDDKSHSLDLSTSHLIYQPLPTDVVQYLGLIQLSKKSALYYKDTSGWERHQCGVGNLTDQESHPGRVQTALDTKSCSLLKAAV